jgi:hypothetical protein
MNYVNSILLIKCCFIPDISKIKLNSQATAFFRKGNFYEQLAGIRVYFRYF